MRRYYARTLLSLLCRAEGAGSSRVKNTLECVVGDTKQSCIWKNVFLGGLSPYSTSKLEFGCWRCGHRDPSLYTCHKCGTIQPPKDCLDAYALFGLNKEEYVFDIPLDELERKYKMLQKTMHPDKFSSATDEEKQYSAEQAALINRAYATLRDPVSRGSHLLSLSTEHEEDEKDMMGGMHSDMLEAIMECREEIEEAEDEETLKDLKTKVGREIDVCVQKLKSSFDIEKDFKKAKEELHALRYLVRMQEAIIDKM